MSAVEFNMRMFSYFGQLGENYEKEMVEHFQNMKIKQEDLRQAVRDYYDEYNNKMFEDFDSYERRLYEEQSRLRQNMRRYYFSISRLSPACCLKSIAQSIAHTGPQLREDFLTSLINYENELNDFVQEKLLSGQDVKPSSRGYFSIDPDESGIMKVTINKMEPESGISKSELPRFLQYSPSVIACLYEGAFDIFVMAILMLILILASYFRFVCYDVR
jgi:hypothetical protein